MNQKTEIEALLEWINVFSDDDWIDNPGSLGDGQKIWAILGNIDPEYFPGNLPEGPNRCNECVSRWQNLKQIFKLLIPYLANQCRKNPPQEAAIIDLQAIAKGHSVGETVKFLKLILLAAINCPKRETYIAEITQLSTSAQMAMMMMISEMQKNDEEKSEPENITLPPTPIGDPELLYEERLGELIADNENHIRDKKELQTELRDLHDRLTRLQENNDAYRERLSGAENKLRVGDSLENAKNEASLKLMRSTLRQQEDLIAAYEISQAKYEQRLKKLQVTVDKLTASGIKHSKISDDLDVLKAERDCLARKAKTAEIYKQKLEANESIQKENVDLREELNEVHEQLQSAQSARDRVAGLEVAIEEYQRTLAKIEQDRHELQTAKQHLEFDNDAFAQRCEAADEQIARDKETIANLTDKLRSFDSQMKSNPVNGKGLANGVSKNAEEKMYLDGEAFELETENHQLKATVKDQEAKIKALQQLLDNAKIRRQIQEKEQLETHRRLLNIESTVGAPSSGKRLLGLTNAEAEAEASTDGGDNFTKENQKHTLLSNTNRPTDPKEKYALNDLGQSVKANSAKQKADIEVSRKLVSNHVTSSTTATSAPISGVEAAILSLPPPAAISCSRYSMLSTAADYQPSSATSPPPPPTPPLPPPAAAAAAAKNPPKKKTLSRRHRWKAKEKEKEKDKDKKKYSGKYLPTTPNYPPVNICHSAPPTIW